MILWSIFYIRYKWSITQKSIFLGKIVFCFLFRKSNYSREVLFHGCWFCHRLETIEELKLLLLAYQNAASDIPRKRRSKDSKPRGGALHQRFVEYLLYFSFLFSPWKHSFDTFISQLKKSWITSIFNDFQKKKKSARLAGA